MTPPGGAPSGDSRIQHLLSGVWVKARIPNTWIRQDSGDTATIEWFLDGRTVLDLKIQWQIHRDTIPPSGGGQ